VIDGRLSLDDNSLRTGDAAKITGENALQSAMEVAAELILIDVRLEFESVGVWRAAEMVGSWCRTRPLVEPMFAALSSRPRFCQIRAIQF
jgi:hypothetical protein